MKKIMLLFAVACVMAACNNDNEPLNEIQYITEFTADFGGANSRMTTTHTPGSGLSFAWEANEYLYVYPAGEVGTQSSYVYNSGSGKFELIGTGGMEVGKSYFAINRIGSYTVAGDNITFATNNIDSNPVGKVPVISDVFTATEGGTIAAMHHTVGVVEVPVKLSAEGSVVTVLKGLGLSTTSTETQCAGEFTATPASPYFVEKTGSSQTAWANMGDTTLNEETATSIFIPMLPGTYTNADLRYKYLNDKDQDSGGIGGTVSSLTVVCGKITKIDEVTLTLN